MGLRIVYGRAGSGKSSFCYNEIREKISGADKAESGARKRRQGPKPLPYRSEQSRSRQKKHGKDHRRFRDIQG